MCFSATASFMVSGLLLLLSGATFAKVKNKAYYLIAAVPLLFSMQQAIEGVLWLSFTHPSFDSYRDVATKGFLFFVYLLWPIWVPFSLQSIVQKSKTKQLINCCLAVGLIAAVIFGISFSVYPVTATIKGNHIVYASRAPMKWWIITGVLYVIATILPFFFIQKRKSWIFGSLLAASYIIGLIFYFNAFVSVWCFFVALLSVLVYLGVE